MYSYRYLILKRSSGKWNFEDAFMTEEAADKHAELLSLGRNRVKVIERYEDETHTARILRIFYYYDGRYHHTITKQEDTV